MALFDLPLAELQGYLPDRTEPADFDAFWKRTLDLTDQHPLAATFTRTPTNLRLVDSYDVTFAGWNGEPVRGWFTVPAGATGPLPCVVEYIGYGGGRGLPHDRLVWAVAGYAHLLMDTRGQGGRWSVGATVDTGPAGPNHPGFMTRGIFDPHDYYYRRLFTDGVRAVQAARGHPLVDPAKVAVTGGSQGGGITVAVSGLVGDLAAVMPDVPFLSHFRRATEITDEDPYAEISSFLKIHRNRVEQVFTTLSYFDGMNFAARANAPALFSVGLMDPICPPSTVYAAYNHYAGPKEIRVYPYNEHEGGQSDQTAEQLAYLSALWAG